ncbi:MAG: hypothetical protein ACLQIQ_02860 [Beijerinckiaceae bacterium]
MRRQKLAGYVSISLLAIGLTAALSLRAAAGDQFDGVYNVDVSTDVGNCDKTYHGAVTIEGGHVVSTSDAAATAWGIVGSDGTVSMQFHRGDELVHVAGYAKGVKAKGTWSNSVSQCGGRWWAERRG